MTVVFQWFVLIGVAWLKITFRELWQRQISFHILADGNELPI